MPKDRLYLVDATAFCYRAFYALKGLSTSFGQPTGAIYGFVRILNRILKEKNPKYLAVCFDVSRDTFRQKMFAGYKVHRPPMPEGLSSQIPLIKDIVRAWGIRIFEKEGFEADDIIASLASCAKDKGIGVTIVSSDKDMLQLVDEDTVVFSPYKDAGTTYDRKKVFERFGVEPARIVDIIALMGDETDNIPGAAGIGEKTAVELINNFGSLDDLLDKLDEVKPQRLKNTLRQNIENIKMSRDLALLKADACLEPDLEKLKASAPDSKELSRLFRRLEFKSLVEELSGEAEQEAVEEELPVIEDSRIKDRIKPEEELILYGRDAPDMVFYAKGSGMFSLPAFGPDIKALLSERKVKKTGHDLKKIKVSLARRGINLDGLHFDTMIAAYLLNPSKPEYTPADLSWDYLSTAVGNNLSSRRAVDIIRQLKPVLEAELKDKSLFSLFTDVEMPLVEVLAHMELDGITLDVPCLKRLSEDLEKRLIGLIEEIYRACDCQFNLNSPKQLREVLFDRLKLPVIKRGKTGPSTDEEVLKTLAETHRLPALLLEYRQITKLKSTYIDTLPGMVDPATGRIHASFNQAATETGRLSSSNPNLQNIPVKTDIGRSIRRAIIPSSKDNCILSCDYSQIELRILAHMSDDEDLIAAFNQGQDIHKITSSLIYGIPEKDVDEAMRESAKRVNFGIVYGLTAYGLSRDLGIAVDEAQVFIDAYMQRYPGVRDYILNQVKRAKEDGFVTTILGRRRYIPEINSKNQAMRQLAERQAVNTPIQGSASDLIKLAMVRIHNLIMDKGYGSRMVIQIHDELVFDVPGREADEFTPLVKDSMENVLTLKVPVKVAVKRGKNWMEMEEVRL